jgi:hypothetical protein
MKWTDPSPARMERIAQRLRWQDRLEVLYSDGKTPEEAVNESWQNAAICRCIAADDGRAVGICGVNQVGNIWLLATDELLEQPGDRRQFIREGRRWVDALLRDHGYQLLENWALASSASTLRWLKWLGFTIDPPQPRGRSCMLFCHFWRAA